ncbi:MAG TPA: ABC transporter ATP-binding protein [Cyclobacteriaceae bacterium]|nr:ABC transporter ATP-binding protein [Cyclobacteriaceae bacterium]
MLETRDLKKRFGRLDVLKGIDIRIKSGITTAILGPNGSGKTTLLKSILGQVRPKSGEIYFKGQPVSGKWEYRKEIGYLPQSSNFPENLKVSELIRLVEDIRGRGDRKNHLMDIFNLNPSLGKRIKNLSGGTRQKVNLLLTFMFDCPLYILDEPASGLDPVAMLGFRELILSLKEQEKTILVTTHIMGLAEEIADEVVFLLEGKVYFTGALRDLLAHAGEYNLERAIAEIMMKQHGKNSEIQLV